MRIRSAIFYLLLVLSPVIVYLLWPSDEARIRKLIKAEIKAAELEDIDGFMGGIAFHYSDEHGLSYALLRRAVEAEFKRSSAIGVEFEGLVIEVKDKRAVARMDMMVLAERGGGAGRAYWWGAPGDPVHLSLELEKNPAGKWLIRGARAGRDGLGVPPPGPAR
jgi:hypothetical protein